MLNDGDEFDEPEPLPEGLVLGLTHEEARAFSGAVGQILQVWDWEYPTLLGFQREEFSLLSKRLSAVLQRIPDPPQT